MLLLILRTTDINIYNKFNLNTSHVIVNLKILVEKTFIFQHLNTSHAIVNLHFLLPPFYYYLNLNTSHVIVNPYTVVYGVI